MKIGIIKKEEIEKGVKVLTDAFENEGFTKTVYDFSRKDTKKYFYLLALLKAGIYHAFGNTILVARENDDIMGIAIIKRDIKIPLRAYYSLGKKNIFPIIKLFAGMRWKKAIPLFGAMKEPGGIKNTSITLEAIAVAPGYQGLGVGKKLLNEVYLTAKNEKKDIYLFTSDEKNKDIYEHFGYEIIDLKKGSELTVYHMLRKV